MDGNSLLLLIIGIYCLLMLARFAAIARKTRAGHTGWIVIAAALLAAAAFSYWQDYETGWLLFSLCAAATEYASAPPIT